LYAEKPEWRFSTLGIFGKGDSGVVSGTIEIAAGIGECPAESSVKYYRRFYRQSWARDAGEPFRLVDFTIGPAALAFTDPFKCSQ
jgi:hypothetical protein